MRLDPLGEPDPSQRITLSIGLPLRDPAGLEHLLEQIYDPASPDYRRYLTAAQFTERFAATEADYQAVLAFARTNRLEVKSVDPGRILLPVGATIADIEKAFRLRLHRYQHPGEPRQFYAPDTEPWVGGLPIAHITGLDNFVIPRPASLGKASSASSAPGGGSAPGGNLIGYDIRAAYVPGVAQTGSGQTVGLLEFDGYYTNDISAYEMQAGLPAVPLVNVPVGGFDMQPSTNANHVMEVSMDIEMVISMAPGVSQIIVYEVPEGFPANDALEQMATNNLPRQISSSWFFAPDATTDLLLKRLAAQGQSFFEASGDDGGYANGINFSSHAGPPADHSWVTSVGGTTLTTSGPGGFWVSETVWNNNTSGTGTNASGGGISTNYSIPAWQINTSMAANGGSTQMRNIPDVAMPAQNIWVVYNNGESTSAWGTSAAAPLWAGFTALVNETAAAHGYEPVGFLNPALYRVGNSTNSPGSFYHDITTGNNTNSASPNLFRAVPGYDLCTGWGSPKGMNLIRTLVFTDSLEVFPGADFSFGGAAGGPFSLTNQTFLLTNTGASNLAWSAASSSAWLSVSPQSGILAGSASTTLKLAITPLAANLENGWYSGNIVFRNTSIGSQRLRNFVLQVGLLPTGFDELGGGGNRAVPQGYAGLYWNNFDFLDALDTTLSPSGYQNGMISPPNVIFNLHGNPASIIGVIPFDLLSTYVTAAWRDNLTLQVVGSSDGATKFAITTNLSTTTPILLQFNFFGVDRVDFVTSGGTTNGAYAESGFQFAMDDVLIAPHLLGPQPPPTLAASFAEEAGGFDLTWPAQIGQSYQVQFSDTLSNPDWSPLGLPITAVTAVTNLLDASGAQGRFYRVQLLP